jgi:hypothetical protein
VIENSIFIGKYRLPAGFSIYHFSLRRFKLLAIFPLHNVENRDKGIKFLHLYIIFFANEAVTQVIRDNGRGETSGDVLKITFHSPSFPAFWFIC